MKYFLLILCLSIFFSCIGSKNSSSANQQLSGDLLIENINIVDVENNRLIREQDVLIRNKRISEIFSHATKKLTAPVVVNGKDKYLIPGLWDMHTHPLSKRDLLLMLIHGVTGTRIMDGDTTTLGWKRQQESGELQAPKIYTAGETFEGTPPKAAQNLVLSLEGWEVANTREDAIAAVQRHKRMGYDFIKIYNNLRDSVVEAIFEEAKRLNMDVCGHVPIETGLIKSIRLGIKSVEHLRGYIFEVGADNSPIKPSIDFRSRTLAWNYIDSSKVDKMIDLTIASKVWNCPTFTFELILSSQKNIDDYLATPEATYLLPKDFKYYSERKKIPWASNFSEQDFNNTIPSLKNRFDFVNKLHKRGGLLLAGTDADVYGPSLHRELQNLSACGLSNYDVLKTATINPAIYFGIQKDYGTVEKNKIADLLILEQNPIENINNTQSIFAVIQNGKLITNEEIIKKKKELKTLAGKNDFKLRR